MRTYVNSTGSLSFSVGYPTVLCEQAKMVHIKRRYSDDSLPFCLPARTIPCMMLWHGPLVPDRYNSNLTFFHENTPPGGGAAFTCSSFSTTEIATPASAIAATSSPNLWPLELRRNGHGTSAGRSANSCSCVLVMRPEGDGNRVGAKRCWLQAGNHEFSSRTLLLGGRKFQQFGEASRHDSLLLSGAHLLTHQ